MSRIIPVDPHNASLYVRMAPRRLRRMIQGKNFIPVYGYRGAGATPPADTVEPAEEDLNDIIEDEERSEQNGTDQ